MATKKYVSLDKLTKYDALIKSHIDTKDAAVLASAKEFATNLGVNYDAAGSASTVQGNLDSEVSRAKAEEARIAGLVSTAQGEVDALEGKVGEVADGSTVVGMIDAVDAKADENAADIVTMKGQIDALEKGTYDDTEVRGLIDELDENKADKTQVATDIAAAVKTETDARVEAVAGVQGAVDTLAQTHATDKSTLEGAIALKADQSALEVVSGVANAAATKVEFNAAVEALEGEDARIEGLVEAEAERAAGVESGLNTRLVKVETFFETAEGETISDAMDTLVEIQKYITEDGAAADEMVKDIAANAKSIADHIATDHDFAAADATLKSELEGKINAKADSSIVEGIDGRLTTAEGKITTVEGKVSTLEGKMTTVEGAVATKAEQSALTEAIESLEGADEELAGRIETLEGKFGGAEGSVEDQIADAKQEAIDAAAADATTKANTAESNAKGHADSLNTAMDARVGVVEAKAHEHSNKALLDTYTQTEANLADAVAKKHEHSNLSVLEGITSAKVTAWDGKADKATTLAGYGISDAYTKTETDTAISTAMSQFVEVSEEEINALFA